jgi:hypothetical protein
MYALLEDVEAETAADSQLRTFLGQQSKTVVEELAATHAPRRGSHQY